MARLDITISQLFQGCIVSSIAHAVWSKKYPFAKYWLYWEDNNCHFNDTQGNLATITFQKKGVVGAIFRKEFIPEESLKDYKNFLDRILAEIPSNLRLIVKEETLQYFIQYFKGKEIPLISDIIWSSDDFLNSYLDKKQWNKIWLKLLDKQLLDFNESLLSCKTNYNLNPNELQVIAYISKKKLQNPTKKINVKLDPEMSKIIYDKDYNTTIDLLERMNIMISN